MSKSLSVLQFGDLIVIPCGADVGITESPENLVSNTVAADWNGIPIVEGPEDRGTLVTTISADGTRWGPTLQGVRARTQLVLLSARWEGALIPAGMSSVVLDFDPVPDPKKPHGYAVLAHRADDGRRRLPLAVDGRLVTLAQVQDVPVSVQFRPVRLVEVVEVIRGAADTVRGTQGWSLKVVDRTP